MTIQKESVNALPIRDVAAALGLGDIPPGGVISSPFREDRNPSFQVGGQKNICYDHALCESFDCVALIQAAQKRSFPQACEWAGQHFGLPGSSPGNGKSPSVARTTEGVKSPGTSLNDQATPSTEPDGLSQKDDGNATKIIQPNILQLAKIRGWNPQALVDLMCHDSGREVRFLMFDDTGPLPVGKKRRNANGSPFLYKNKEKKSMVVGGSKLGLLYPRPFPSDGAIWLVEGEADLCAALSYGHQATIGTASASIGPIGCEALPKMCEGRSVIVWPDRDVAGYGWIERLVKILPDLRVALLPESCPNPQGDDELQIKDLDDAFQAGVDLSSYAESPLSVDEALGALSKFKKGAKLHDKKDRAAKQASSDDPNKPDLILPSGAAGEYQPSDLTAQSVFTHLAGNGQFFYRAGEAVRVRDGAVVSITPETFQTLLDKHFNLLAWVSGKGGPFLTRKGCNFATAKQLLASDEKNLLPKLRGVSRLPVLSRDGTIAAGPGYDTGTGWYILSNLTPTAYETPQHAATKLLELLVDFRFQTESDRSRAVAAILTPAFRMSGQHGHSPLSLIEADQSQTGKGYFLNLISAIYGEPQSMLTNQNGGVGGLDEKLQSKLLSGRPIIVLDNIRGKVDSQFLESALTTNGTMSCRVPFRPTLEISVSIFCFFATSNGAVFTRDLSNRSNTVRLLKQESGYQFQTFQEGDLLEHAEACRGDYLGAVFSVMQGWIAACRPRERTTHDLRPWAGGMNWIVQNYFDLPDMDAGVSEIKQRLSSHNGGLLRAICLFVRSAFISGWRFSVNDLEEKIKTGEISLDELDSKPTNGMALGRELSRYFPSGTDSCQVEGFRVERLKNPHTNTNEYNVVPCA